MKEQGNKPRGRGRPSKPGAEKLSEQVNVRMTKQERLMINTEATKLGISLSALLMRPWRKEE